MIIAIAGPYSAPTEEGRQANLSLLNEGAARVLEMGHIPLIGVNAALPVVEKANVADKYKAMMDISMAVIDKCEALLLIAESPGANRERDWVLAKGLPVYYSLEEIPRG
jgi:hypothetical protein